MILSKENPNATEHKRGNENLYATCDTFLERAPARMTLCWRKTTSPCTSPMMGTPAWAAYCAGEAVWEPVFVIKK